MQDRPNTVGRDSTTITGDAARLLGLAARIAGVSVEELVGIWADSLVEAEIDDAQNRDDYEAMLLAPFEAPERYALLWWSQEGEAGRFDPITQDEARSRIALGQPGHIHVTTFEAARAAIAALEVLGGKGAQRAPVRNGGDMSSVTFDSGPMGVGVLPTFGWGFPPPPPPSCCPAVPLQTAIERLLAAKKRANRRPKTIVNLRQYLVAFARRRKSTPISEINHGQVEEWLARHHKSSSGRATGINRLSGLFSFAVRQGWIVTNPCSRIERISVEHAPPKILTAAESARLLEEVAEDARPLVVLGLFVGLRPSEAERLDWSAIDLRDGVLTVDAAASKVRRRRIIRLLPSAIAWLRVDAMESGPCLPSDSTLRRRRREAAEAAGVKWTQDILRHTHASMRMAADANAHQLADEMGNSPRILLTHYRELVRRDEAERFWALRP